MKLSRAIVLLSCTLILVQHVYPQVGIIDPNFSLGTGFGPDQWTGRCHSLIQQPDGKLLVSGLFSTYNGDTTIYITRLNLDGTRDKSFTSYFSQSPLRYVKTMALQDDGKIVVGGYFSRIQGIPRNNIARLNSDGSLDTTFNPASGFDLNINSVCIQPDGKIVVGGVFSTYDHEWGGSRTPVNGIARLNADGSLDNTFSIGTGFSGSTGIGQREIHKVVLQPDGKILVGGHFSLFNNTSSLLVTRLNADGTIDDTFNAQSNFSLDAAGYYGQVYDIVLLPNGQILISGNYGNTTSLSKGIDRLNADGSMDNTFRISHQADFRCFAFDVQSDGKIITSRVNFGSADEAYVIERLNADGSLDVSFPARYVNNDVNDVLVQNDGNITIVGYFTYNPTGIMRLIGDTPHSTSVPAYSENQLHYYPNPASDVITLSNLPINSSVRILDVTGRIVYSAFANNDQFVINVKDLKSGLYVVHVEHNNVITSNKLLINN